MSKPLYHVRHDLQPALTLELLLLLHAKSPCKIEQLQYFAQERGYYLANRTLDQLLASLSNLKIIERTAVGTFDLTSRGQLIARAAQQQPELVAELIHFTYYTLYDGQTPALRFSWAYRQVCDFLWSQNNLLIDSNQLVTLVQEQAQLTFEDTAEFGVSFSRDSVTGILHWLEHLDPPCIRLNTEDKRVFARRLTCPTVGLLLALEQQAQPFGTLQLHLTPQVRQATARLCLLEPESLDDMLPELAQALGLAYRQTERGQWLSLPGRQAPFPITAWAAD